MPARVLIVDDELAIRRLLRNTLARAGYVVDEAVNGREALAMAASADAVLLDLGLPDRDGLTLVPLLRRAGGAAVVPEVIVVSARDATEEKVAALDLGAADYVTKPFDTDELLARLRAALRHRDLGQPAPRLIRSGAVEIDLEARVARRDGVDAHLTRKEHDVLTVLAEHPGRVVTHSRIMAAAWPHEREHKVEYLRIVIRHLRAKLEGDAGVGTVIANELGVGYRLLV